MVRANKLCTVITAVLSLLLLVVPGLIQAGPPIKNNVPKIRLGGKAFAPSQGEKLVIPPGLAIKGYRARERGYYIVQFSGPIYQNWKEQVAGTGAELLDYIPDFAFRVRMTPAQALEVEELESVIWVGLYQPAYKLSPDLIRNGTHVYKVRLERSSDVKAVRAAIARSGAQVLTHKGNIVKVAANSAQLNAIARVLDVAWVENFMMWEKHNEYAAGQILGGNMANSSGYDGSSQIIGIADTGLGDGTYDTAYPDIPSDRILTIIDWPGSSGTIDIWCKLVVVGDHSVDVDSGHGTHLALSALGAKGTAPGAKLFFQSVENYVDFQGGWADPTTDFWCYFDHGYVDGYYLIGIPSNIGDLFQQAYNGGARVHSDSWGTDAMGAYTVDSRNADLFIWNHQDMTITYSAANSGRDANGDGVVDSDSIGAPSTAKNVITVGASENNRQENYPCDTSLTYTSHDPYQPGETCSSMGGNNYLGTWGQRYPSNFPSGPIASDVTAGNAEQMAGWSSRGPTNDGRIKPDVVAPGTWILSGYSDKYQEGYDVSVNPQNSAFQWDGWGMPESEQYKYMGGTSMSSPLVAGASAVVRDFYQKEDDHNASAALVKATLINSAHDLLDENNDGFNDNDFPIPNDHEGWGRVDLANATDGSHQYRDETTGLATVGSSTYQYSVAPGGHFKVTLVWSDYPSATGVSKNLVNDLDLVVTSPGGTIYYGNVFSGGWSIPGGTVDRINNVENVYIQFPEEGTWKVDVKGYNVPQGPQPFALVVDGANTNMAPTAVLDANPTSGTKPLTVNFYGSESFDSDGSIEAYAWDFGDGGTSSAADPVHIYQTAGEFYVELTVTDNDGAPGTATQTITVTAPTNTMHLDSLSVKTKAGRWFWSMNVTATVKDANGGPVAGATVWYSWSDSPGSVYGDCRTGQNGECSVVGFQFRGTCLTFTVEDVSHSTLTYDPGQDNVNDISACK
jgi:PKD repeat protein